MSHGPVSILIIPFLVAMLGSGLVGALTGHVTAQQVTVEAADAAQQLRSASAPMLFPLREQVVQLAEGGSRRYARTRLLLEVSTDPIANTAMGLGVGTERIGSELRDKHTSIDDAISTALASKTAEELSTVPGQQAFKDEVKQRINGMLGRDVVKSVVFSELMVQ